MLVFICFHSKLFFFCPDERHFPKKKLTISIVHALGQFKCFQNVVFRLSIYLLDFNTVMRSAFDYLIFFRKQYLILIYFDLKAPFRKWI